MKNGDLSRERSRHLAVAAPKFCKVPFAPDYIEKIYKKGLCRQKAENGEVLSRVTTYVPSEPG